MKILTTSKELKVGMIGLDTSHSIEFTRLMQAPDYPEEKKVKGMRVISCLRFPSPFQSEPDQDKRQKQLEEWGVNVTRNLEEVLEGIDVIMLEINDPSLHLKYFKKVIGMGKPIFLDKPPADNLKNVKEIFNLAKKIRIFSASSLRFCQEVIKLSEEISGPKIVMSIGPLGKAPSGSSIIWYGVHAVEMLERIIGKGAKSVSAHRDTIGVVAIIEYSDDRRGIVQLNENDYRYAVFAQNEKEMKCLNVGTSNLYKNMLTKIKEFFEGVEHVSIEETIEVQTILDAIERSVQKFGKKQIIS